MATSLLAEVLLLPLSLPLGVTEPWLESYLFPTASGVLGVLNCLVFLRFYMLLFPNESSIIMNYALLL